MYRLQIPTRRLHTKTDIERKRTFIHVKFFCVINYFSLRYKMSSVGELVDQFIASPPINDADRDSVETLRQIANSDPVVCRDITEAIKRKLYCSVESEQLRAADLLDKLVDVMDLTFQQVVNEKDFLSSLEN